MRKLSACLSITLLAILALQACGGDSSSGTGSGSSGNTSTSQADFNSSVNHIVFMFQENRSFDSYFGQLNAFRTGSGLGADVDGLTSVTPQPPSNPTRDFTGTIEAFAMRSACTENISPSWNESHRQRNVRQPNIASPALMDGFVDTAAGFAIADGLTDTEGRRAMGYYDQNILPYYYSMATNFATSDRWFSPVLSKSEPNRLFGLAATSGGNTGIPSATLSQKTIFHLLESANVSWKVYTTDRGSTFMSYFQPFTNNHSDKIVPLSEYFSDLKNGTLPSVALIESGYASGRDEHPKANIQTGAAHVATIINALMGSTSWKDSVFVLTYDEAGGIYDHVAPIQAAAPDGLSPILSDDVTDDFGDQFTLTGFRVPLIVVSPFTRRGFVSHTQADYTAILKLIEDRFNLPTLTARDAAQPSMMEYFDVKHPAWMTPPNPPAQPVSAPCYYNSLP